MGCDGARIGDTETSHQTVYGGSACRYGSKRNINTSRASLWRAKKRAGKHQGRADGVHWSEFRVAHSVHAGIAKEANNVDDSNEEAERRQEVRDGEPHKRERDASRNAEHKVARFAILSDDDRRT